MDPLYMTADNVNLSSHCGNHYDGLKPKLKIDLL